MTLFYLALAIGIAVLMNLRARWGRLAGQALAAIALFFNIWSIWLAVDDGTFAAARAHTAQVLSLELMGLIGVAGLLALLLLLPGQWRRGDPVHARNHPQGWGQASRLLHWTSAVLMLSALPIGLFVAVLPQGPMRAEYLAGHIGVGLAVLALLLARLGWQAASPGPAAPNALARLNKAALYGLLAALPASGLALASATGAPVLGLQLPDAMALPPARLLHQALSALFAAAFAAHLAGVIHAQWRARDARILRRMLR
jgi:cytochrome b561